ncbi:MAG: class II aldolase/adducin family protein [Deltaproteobacteria bacterium]|nr:class II aldolase/adducin family protein [Deltaproteobacteria bacterium]
MWKRWKRERRARSEMVEICRRLHHQGLIPGGDGNVSIRLSSDEILITPSGVNKGYLDHRDLVLIRPDGKPFHKESALPSSEKLLHLAAYETRQDISAVLHAHPPTVVALSIMGLNPAMPLMPESVVSLGNVAIAPYAKPGGTELPDSIRPFLPSSHIIILKRHGCVILGKTLTECYNAMERLEHAAKVVATVHQLGLGTPIPFSAKEIEELVSIRAPQ